MFEGFDSGLVQRDGCDVFYRRKGQGSAILFLHGFPQTHVMWAKIAAKLAQEYTVVCADLRGYGASGKPKGVAQYSFREMGADQLHLMADLGFKRFHLVGHDRGGRTAHRMALDAPDRIKSLTIMDIVPTHLLLEDLNKEVARAYYHWFFLAQPSPFPENLILSDPDVFFQNSLISWGSADLAHYAPEQLQAYRASWRDPDCVRSMCDDYRAAIDYDFALDAEDIGRRLRVPSLVMWGEDGAMAKAYDMASVWSNRLSNFSTAAVRGGHFFPDTASDETYQALREFLRSITSLDRKF